MEVFAALGAVAVIVLLAILKQFIVIVRPNQMMVISGRRRLLGDGSQVNYDVKSSGAFFRKPFVERVDPMDMRNIPIDIRITNAYSEGGIPLDVHAIANVKVSNDSKLINNAIERFLGREIGDLRQVAKETLEGHLRGVLATLTPEEVNEDRLKFAEAMSREAGEDLTKLGLHLDTLKIQAVDDQVNYLASIGRQSIALVVRDAEVAESIAKSEAQQTEAKARQEGQIANEQAESIILQKTNEVRRIKAEFEARARAEEETTEQAALEARARAEQELQELRREVERIRLIADVVLPAEANREAAALKARGQAAEIQENGHALAEVLRLMTDAWLKAGTDAKDIFLIQNLEQVLSTVVDRVNAVDIDEVTLLDDGSGSSLAAYASAYPAMVSSVLKELQASTGVDVLGILKPHDLPQESDTFQEND